MGCFVTIFSYYGYKKEIYVLVRQMCRAGLTFFDTHLDNEASCEDWRLNVMPR